MCVLYFFVCDLYGDRRDPHVLTHSFPTRRSSDLAQRLEIGSANPYFGSRPQQHMDIAITAIADGFDLIEAHQCGSAHADEVLASQAVAQRRHGRAKQKGALVIMEVDIVASGLRPFDLPHQKSHMLVATLPPTLPFAAVSCESLLVGPQFV